jgi:hypothetical protein
MTFELSLKKRRQSIIENNQYMKSILWSNFYSIFFLIQSKYFDTFVKTLYPPDMQSSDAVKLAIPIWTFLNFSGMVRGPPLSPEQAKIEKKKLDEENLN